MVKMIDLDRHTECPLGEALASPQIPWTGMRYACLKVLHAYCKVFDKKDIYDLIVRKTCKSCKCARESHAIYHEQLASVRERIGINLIPPTHWESDPREFGYTWVPPGIRASSKINRYFEQFPKEKVPKIGTDGERYREHQIVCQLPKQDLSLEYCKHLEAEYHASYEDFVAGRNEIALDIGYVKDAPHDADCVRCMNPIDKGDMTVVAPKLDDSNTWHPNCFVCSTCEELLVDLTYCVHDDKIYCERHYSEILKPRCNGCDEPFKNPVDRDRSVEDMGELLAEVGDLLFTLVIGYMGAVELLYVVRHLYHWSFHQSEDEQLDDDTLHRLQESTRNQLAAAEAREAAAGANAMQDGVLYKDGIRIDPQQQEIEEMKEAQRQKEEKEQRRKELEAELAKQKKIEEETRLELEKAEAELERQRREAAAEEEQRLLAAEREKESQQRKLELEKEEQQRRLEMEQAVAAEEEQRLLEVEREKEEQQRRLEMKQAIEAEEEQRMLANEREKEEQQRRLEMEQAAAAEEEQRLLEVEREKEEQQRRLEMEQAVAAEEEQRLLEVEREKEEQQRRLEMEQAIEAEEDQRMLANEREKEEQQRRLEMEQAAEEKQRLLTIEREKEEQQRMLEMEQAVAAEEQQRMMAAEREKEEQQRMLEMEEALMAEEEQRILAAEREKEELQRMLEMEEEIAAEEKRVLAAEREIEEKQRMLEMDQETAIEDEQQMLKIESDKQEHQRKIDIEEEQRILAAEQWQLEKEQIERVRAETEFEEQKSTEERKESEDHRKQKETIDKLSKQNNHLRADAENSNHILEAERLLEEKQKHLEQKQENSERLLLAEHDSEFEEQETDRLLIAENEEVHKQKLIEENARIFLEAEQQMVVELERQMEETIPKRNITLNQQISVVEEPCIKRAVSPLTESERVPQTVKTQFGQTSDKPYSHSSKTLLFPGISDDASSVEPISSQQSSFSTQQSEDVTPDADELRTDVGVLGSQIEIEREAPDGEDNAPSVQYTDDYLRSLDGIKQRPLVREDGSGRRRAFKKRRSSGSSHSSRDSRTSREEEIKMFTSLEEEEMQGDKNVDIDFNAIKYSSEPTLKVKSQSRRHKRSPAKDMKSSEESRRSSLEMLGEENSDPWGEVVPEHYKDTAFWKREKAMSIDEEEIEMERPASQEQPEDLDTATIVTKTSSFEEATITQNEEALSLLKDQLSKELGDENRETTSETRNDKNTNLQTSQNTEDTSSPARSSSSPRLRRSPRIDEIDQYEERWKETAAADANTHKSNVSTPSINVQHSVDNAPWRDDYGLLMEGLSDFYDFTASVNPSRSRSTSRNPSRAATPSSPKPNFTYPKNVAYNPHEDNNESADLDIISFTEENTHILDVYDDTGTLANNAITHNDLKEFMNTLNSENGDSPKHLTEINPITDQLKNVADDPNNRPEETNTEVLPSIRIDTSDFNSDTVEVEISREEMTLLVESLRTNRSHSRSRSPLPTPDNMQRSINSRREKLIQHNDEILNKMMEGSHSPEIKISMDSQVEDKSTDETGCTENDMNSLVQTLRAERCRSKSVSRSPLPTSDNIQRSLNTRRDKRIQYNDQLFEKLEKSHSPEHSETHIETPSISVEYIVENSIVDVDNDCSKENISGLIESLRVDRTRSRSRSKTPMRIPSAENLSHSVNNRRNKLIQQNDDFFEQLATKEMAPQPEFTVEYVYEIVDDTERNTSNEEPCSRSRECSPSRSSSPAQSSNYTLPRGHSRSRTPSRSQSPSSTELTASKHIDEYTFMPRESTRSNFEDNDPQNTVMMDNLSDYYDFHQMLNMEASRNKTLSKNTEEIESSLAVKQRLADDDALHKLRTADTEVELRTVTPIDTDDGENYDILENMSRDFNKEMLKQLKCTPTTPDYDRSMSTEWNDVQRIKNEILASGYKRSTYVGESMDLGSEYEELRRETAQFRRSQSKSRSPVYNDTEIIEKARRNAAEKRQLQSDILAEITTNIKEEPEKMGAKPKTDMKNKSVDYEHSFSKEWIDTQRIKDEMLSSGFQRSTYVGESLDMSAQFEELRREAYEFRRSQSKSRSPLDAEEVEEIKQIDAEAAKREMQDRILDEITRTTINFQEFSRNLNADFLDSERRASDSALIQRPEILIQIQDTDLDLELEPEEYHHYRRYSLNQEPPVEEYPSDDYVYVSQIEVRTPNGTRTWLREDYFSDDFESLKFELADTVDSDDIPVELIEDDAGQLHEDDYTDGSEDERRTVVEVDDEIDTDICDFNERGPADESHHEQSECEEAEREVDHYANRRADDWKDIRDQDNNTIDRSDCHEEDEVEEGAVGGSGNSSAAAYDSDSFAIDQIYDEAIRNRKQSGILRDYDSILQEMQNHSGNRINGLEDGSLPNESDRYDIWAKTREIERSNCSFRANGTEALLNFMDNERNDTERRYLGDATTTARNSTRLRSRYGYVPVLQSSALEEIDVDLNYKPRHEYKWRKNFKLEEETVDNTEHKNENTADELDEIKGEYFDERKCSLGGESITLFSRSPDRDQLTELLEEDSMNICGEQEPDKHSKCENNIEVSKDTEANVEKPKKKTKKKTRKESKGSIDKFPLDEDDSESQLYSRRSSSIQMEAESPLRKSRSRRSSRSSLINEDSAELFSPRSSIGYAEPCDFIDEYTETVQPTKKKTKKRKKAKETFVHEAQIKEEHVEGEHLVEILPKATPVSAAISPVSASANVLSTLSPQNSVCVTPASMESETSEHHITESMKSAITTSAKPADIDNFDFLKDSNFYPLF